MVEDARNTDVEGQGVAIAAEGVRRFFMEANPVGALRHLSQVLWDKPSDVAAMTALLDAAAGELDRTGEVGEARFCRRMAAEVRSRDASCMDQRGFVVAALRAAGGFDVVRQVEIARMFEGCRDAAVWDVMLRHATEAEWERRRGSQTLRGRIADFVGRLRSKRVAVA